MIVETINRLRRSFLSWSTRTPMDEIDRKAIYALWLLSNRMSISRHDFDFIQDAAGRRDFGMPITDLDRRRLYALIYQHRERFQADLVVAAALRGGCA